MATDRSTSTIEINIDAVGMGTVVVDGIDLSNYVRAVYVKGGVGEPPKVILELTHACEIDARAEVLISKLPAVPDGGAVDITSIADQWRHRRPVDSGDE